MSAETLTVERANGNPNRARTSRGDLLALLAPIAQIAELEVVGRLNGTDVVLAVVLPILLVKRGRRLLDPVPKALLLLLLLWLAGAVATDVARSTPFQDYSRGWSKIVLFGVSFCSLFLLIDGRPPRLVQYIVGLSIGFLVETLLSPDADAMADPWKFGYGPALTMLAFVAACGRRDGLPGRASGMLFVCAAAAANLAFNFRSMFGIAVLAGGLAMVAPGRRRLPRSLPSLLVLAAGAAAAVFAILSVYASLAASGMLGEHARHKFEMQTSGGLGQIMGGRAELLVSSRAILDAPVLGHGSWARDVDYVAALVSILESRGHEVDAARLADDLIPAHSHLFGAWVEAGILGGLFWTFVLGLALLALVALVRRGTSVAPLLAFLLVASVWNVLFSPFGAEQRIVVPAYITAAILALRSRVPAHGPRGQA